MSRPGWPDAVDWAPTPVEQVVDLDEHTVTIDLTATSILTQLALAVQQDSKVRDDFYTVAFGQRNGTQATEALDRLRRNWQVRDALTLTWAPSQVDQLIVALDDAADGPETCTTEHCDWLAQPGTDKCAECLAADDDQTTSNTDQAQVAS